MSVISNVLNVSSFILSLGAVIYAVRLATLAREFAAQLRRSPLSRIQSLETSRDEMQQELLNLANRVKMIKVRRAADHVTGEGEAGKFPDPHTNPEAWRKAMNLDIARRRIGGVSKN